MAEHLVVPRSGSAAAAGRISTWRTITTALLPRALALTVLHVLARTGLAYAVAYWTPFSVAARWLALAVVVVAAAVWGAIDGHRHRARADRSARDLPVFWLGVAFVAAGLSGLVYGVLGQVSSIRTDGNAFVFEVTTGAAWIVLVIYVPAVVGVAIERRFGS
ncbi:B-4DMT family transporter [Nocardia sp. CA-120079]|uniref:B-4DMT family transporter n=1 Tax=Nocardia sp. CA-120079 TaxID=3239974 RepID=UPI003D96F608